MIKVRLKGPTGSKAVTPPSKFDLNMSPSVDDQKSIEERETIGFDKPANKWTTFNYPKRKLRLWERLCVEAYCCGYLEYYDRITRYQFVKHHIYFDWKPLGTKGHSVTVYIDPPPLKQYPPTAQSPVASSDPVPPPKPPPPPMG